MNARDVIAQALALSESATPGPWKATEGDSWVHAPHLSAPHLSSQVEATEVANVFDFDRDAPFIAAARDLLPALAKALGDVLDLHSLVSFKYFARDTYCAGCGATPHERCPTVAAITAALSEVTP